MFKEVMNDLWLARISSLSNEVGLYVVLLEVLLFMPNSLIRHSQKEEFEDTKGVIKIHESKDRQHNGQKKKDKRTKEQTTIYKHTHKTKDRVTRTQLKTGV